MTRSSIQHILLFIMYILLLLLFRKKGFFSSEFFEAETQEPFCCLILLRRKLIWKMMTKLLPLFYEESIFFSSIFPCVSSRAPFTTLLSAEDILQHTLFVGEHTPGVRGNVVGPCFRISTHFHCSTSHFEWKNYGRSFFFSKQAFFFLETASFLQSELLLKNNIRKYSDAKKLNLLPFSVLLPSLSSRSTTCLSFSTTRRLIIIKDIYPSSSFFPPPVGIKICYSSTPLLGECHKKTPPPPCME